MAAINDRVKLKNSLQGYDPDAEGPIVAITDGGNTWTVEIDKDAMGDTVDPPDLLPPSPFSEFQVL